MNQRLNPLISLNFYTLYFHYYFYYKPYKILLPLILPLFLHLFSFSKDIYYNNITDKTVLLFNFNFLLIILLFVIDRLIIEIIILSLNRLVNTKKNYIDYSNFNIEYK